MKKLKLLTIIFLLALLVGAWFWVKYSGWFDRVGYTYFEKGEEFRAEHLFADAIYEYDLAISLAELDGEAAYKSYVSKADIYRQKNKPKEAIQLLENAERLRRDHPEAYIMHANILLDQRNFDGVIELVDSANYHEAVSGDLFLAKARALIAKEASVAEIRAVLSMAENQGSEKAAYYKALMSLRFVDDIENADKIFERIKTESADEDMVRKATVALGNIVNIKDGEEYRPYNSLLIAWLFYELDEIDLAYRESVFASEQLENYTKAMEASAYFLYKMGAAEESLEVDDSLLELDPASSWGRSLKALIYSDRGEYVIANNEIAKALKIDKKSKFVNEAKLEIELSQEKYEDSLHTLNTLIGFNDKNKEKFVLKKYWVLVGALGNFTKAQREIESYLFSSNTENSELYGVAATGAAYLDEFDKSSEYKRKSLEKNRFEPYLLLTDIILVSKGVEDKDINVLCSNLIDSDLSGEVTSRISLFGENLCSK